MTFGAASLGLSDVGTWRRDCFSLAVPLVLAIAVFAQVAGFPFVNWDDALYVTDNPLVAHPFERGLTGLFWTKELTYPVPVAVLSFALDHALAGFSPAWMHLENLLLHLVNVALVYGLARRLGLRVLEACATACIFAAHPLVVEPVCWVTGRKDLLAATFLFLATHVGVSAVGRGRSWWVAANALVICAMLTMPRMLMAAPFVMVAVGAARPDAPRRRLALALTPSLLACMLLARLGMVTLAASGATPPARTFGAIVADVAGACAIGLGHVVWPFDFMTWYARVPGDPPLVAMMLVPGITFVALVVALWRAPANSPVRAGALLTIIAYAPSSALVRSNRWTADSYMYVPLAAVAIAVVPAIARVWPARLQRIGYVSAGALLLILAAFSFAESGRWSSSTRLWEGSIARYPGLATSYAHEALGLRNDGQVEQANVRFIELAEKFPDWDDSYDDEVLAYEAVGRFAEANEVLIRGIRRGTLGCIRLFWIRYLTTNRLPSFATPDLVATAFDNGFDAMKDGISRPSDFDRIATQLDPTRAARAHAQAAELRRAGK